MTRIKGQPFFALNNQVTPGQLFNDRHRNTARELITLVGRASTREGLLAAQAKA